jgi:hypothetical protein
VAAHTVILIEFQHSETGEWVLWAKTTGPEAAKVVLEEYRAATSYQWRAVTMTTLTTVEDW